MNRILQKIQTIVILMLISASVSIGQNNINTNSNAHQTKIELKILNNLTPNDIAGIENTLSNYPEKIISHNYGENKNKVFVFISDSVDPVDILQALKMKGINACYRESDNGFISLEPDGRSTRTLYFKE